MTDLKTIYQMDKDFYKTVTGVGFAEYAARVIVEAMGMSKLTRFEFYQYCHKNIPHLKHIVYNRVKHTFTFLFSSPVDMTVVIEGYRNVEDIDIEKHWSLPANDLLKERYDAALAAGTFTDIPRMWESLFKPEELAVDWSSISNEPKVFN